MDFAFSTHFACLSVCRLSHSCTLLKPFDRLRCHLAGTLRGPMTHCVRWDGGPWTPRGAGDLGSSTVSPMANPKAVPPIAKLLCSLLCVFVCVNLWLFCMFTAVLSPSEHSNVLRRFHQEESERQGRPAVAGDGILWGRISQWSDQVREGQLTAGGLDCIHVQGDPQRTFTPPLPPRHTQRHQGTERPTYWQRWSQTRSVGHHTVLLQCPTRSVGHHEAGLAGLCWSWFKPQFKQGSHASLKVLEFFPLHKQTSGELGTWKVFWWPVVSAIFVQKIIKIL